MTTYGVTDTGFVTKDVNVLLAEIEASERALISANLNVLPTSVIGQINGIFADKLRELWDLAQAIYRSQYPDSASGEALENVAAITGAIRLPASPSTVILDHLFLDDCAEVDAGSLVSVGESGEQFKTLDDLVNDLGYPTTFSVAAESVNDGPIAGYAGTIDTIASALEGWNAKCAISCGTVEGAGYALDGKSLTLRVDHGLVQTVSFATGNPWSAADAAAEIQDQCTGVESYDAGGYVRVASTTDGSGSAIEITGGSANAVLNFDTDEVIGFNSTDATLGRNIETDEELRIRRIGLLSVAGAATVEAIRADLLDVADVIQAFVFENTTDAVDINGLPPHSFEAVVYGGTDAAVAAKIWLTKPAGIETYGSTTESVTDSMSVTHDISFSRPTPVPIFIEAVLTTDPDTFPADGIEQVKAALAVFGDAFQIGDDVIALAAHAVALGVTGVIDVPTFKIDIVDPPTNTGNLTIDFRSIATFDTSHMDITAP